MVIRDLARDPWLWPWSTVLRLAAATLDSFEEFLSSGHSDARPLEPAWTTSRQTLLDLPASRVHDFVGGAGFPIILVPPFALHGPVLADLALGNSLVERLLTDRVGRLLLLECKSASSETRLLGIDDYLAALLVAVEELGGRAALVGLCQGGWLSLMFAARFPSKVSRILLAGSPIDLDAAASNIVSAARATPAEIIQALVESDDGLLRGRTMQTSWGVHDLEQSAVADVLQVETPPPDLVERFRVWHAWTVDLPGPYYVQVVEDLFRCNKLAKGEFVGLGRTLDLAEVRAPIYLLAAQADEVTPPEQVFAARLLVGTAPAEIKVAMATGGHLSLFMGARNLATVWRDAAHWLRG
jgi:poly(3-hydroxybutyrate) depolymerase